MRSIVIRSRIRSLKMMSSSVALGLVVAGCSSGFQRFDDQFYQSAVPQDTSQAQNPYPGDLDPTTTASTRGRLIPLNDVGSIAPSVDPRALYHNPEPTYAAPNNYSNPTSTLPSYNAPTYNAPNYNQNVPSVSSNFQQPSVQYNPQPVYVPNRNTVGNAVVQQNLPKVPTVSSQPTVSYSPPTPQGSESVYIPPQGTDVIQTASITPNPVAPKGEAGWTSTGGTQVVVRSGETLYNLSKRYGVPVSEIRKANNMSVNSSLNAGQRVLIPNYVFAPSAAVSAPDNDPKTRAARAGAGFQGEVTTNKVHVPTPRPYYNYASESRLTPNNTVTTPRAQSSNQQWNPPQPTKNPGYAAPLGNSAVGQTSYMVQSGETLSGIAKKHGTTVSALQAQNNLVGSNIRVGQRLVVPNGSNLTTTAQSSVPSGVDPIVTGSANAVSNMTDASNTPSSVRTPASSGISDFRWPAQGRIVTDFGELDGDQKNEGIDISVPEGTAVRAAENGVVIYVGNEISNYGNLILVRHADDWVSAYAHNRDFEVNKGDSVRRGQIIARSGRTGKTDRPKLHFELRKDSQPVNPRKYLAG